MKRVPDICVFFLVVSLCAAAEKESTSSVIAAGTPRDTSSTAVDSTASITAAKKASEKKDSTTKAASTVLEESEEELILDGGEESIISPEVAPAAQPKSSEIDSKRSSPQSISSVPSAATTDSTAAAGSDSASSAHEQPVFQYPAEAMPKIDEEPSPAPGRIEKVQSINFAKNFKEYRSPKAAIILSLLFPGAGQAYAQNRLKTAIFAAVEAAFITVGAVVAYKGAMKRKDARSFADAHYSADSFAVYYRNMKTLFPDADSTVFAFETQPDTFFSYVKEKNQDYYNLISREVSPYIQGWDDVRPRYDRNFEIANDFYVVKGDTLYYLAHPESTYLSYEINRRGDTSLAQYGFSENIKEYNRRLSKSNSLFRSSERLFTFMLLNHIVSAVDAAITAKAHNDRLLGRTTMWQRLNIREKYVSTPSGTANGFALEVRF